MNLNGSMIYLYFIFPLEIAQFSPLGHEMAKYAKEYRNLNISCEQKFISLSLDRYSCHIFEQICRCKTDILHKESSPYTDLGTL